MSESAEAAEQPAEQWAIVEKMGHVSMAGRLTEEERFGGVMGRIDVPQPDGSFATHFFGAQSVYGVTIVTEAAARKSAERSWPRPVTPYEPKALPPSHYYGPEDEDDEPCNYLERDDDSREMDL